MHDINCKLGLRITGHDKLEIYVESSNCDYGRPQAWARGAFAPLEGALPHLWKCCKVFLCISSYSKTPSRRIIYALFSQTVVWLLGALPGDPTEDPYLDVGPRRGSLVSRFLKSCGRPYGVQERTGGGRRTEQFPRHGNYTLTPTVSISIWQCGKTLKNKQV